jgi:hypothetical protein
VAGEDVAVEDEDGVVGPALQVLGHVADRAAGAQRDVLGGVDQLDAEARAVAEVVEEHLGLVRRAEHDARDAGLAGARDLVLGARDAGHGQHRLGRGDGERAQTRALAADEEDCFQHAATLAHP